MLTDEQKKALTEATQFYFDLALDLFPIAMRGMPSVGVIFNIKGAVAGQACYNKNLIRYNPVLAAENFQTFLTRTVPHEVAHFVARWVYDDHGHKSGWKIVMRRFGVKDIGRCHSYDTRNTRVTFTYKCACSTTQFTKNRHTRSQDDRTYFCRKCKAVFKHVKD